MSELNEFSRAELLLGGHAVHCRNNRLIRINRIGCLRYGGGGNRFSIRIENIALYANGI